MSTTLASWISILAHHPGTTWMAGCAGFLLLALLLLGRHVNRCRPQLVALARVICAWGIAYALLTALANEDIARSVPNLGLTIGAALAALSLLLGRPQKR